MLLIRWPPVPGGTNHESAKPSAHGEPDDRSHCASRSRRFWSLRLHLLATPDGTPRALTLADSRCSEREVGLELLERATPCGEVFICDAGGAERAFPASSADHVVLMVRRDA